GANGIETDVQITKDGVLVLFHDDTLERVTDSNGRVEDYTLAELKNIKVYGNITTGFYDRIPTFEEFLKAFSSYDIHFAIELKFGGYEKEVLEMCEKYGIKEKMTVTSFDFDYIKRVKELDKTVRVGWLVAEFDANSIKMLKDIGGEEMAPEAKFITRESEALLRNEGLGVRAWGVYNTAIMKRMCEVGVDGMTVNFPDRLFNYISAQRI
ncbi:MAG: hypothetical protein IJO52_01630, partial [Clostridia bacterium]|nr:hypothetical protein [Clostridia bacterium]